MIALQARRDKPKAPKAEEEQATEIWKKVQRRMLVGLGGAGSVDGCEAF